MSSLSRLVLAEDDPEMRQLLLSSLQRAGYEVLEARNGSELLEHVGDGERDGVPVELVIADVRMPGISGLQALSYLRRCGCDVPVILITGFGDADVHEKASLLGACAVVDKPFDFEEFKTLVHYMARPVRRW